MARNVIDATNKSLGRLASEAARLLMGKHRADYQPNRDSFDIVEVKNFSQVRFSGQKVDKKIYWRHTGYVGHLKQIKLKELMAKNPKRVLELAVRRMLPTNKLRDKRMKRLVITM